MTNYIVTKPIKLRIAPLYKEEWGVYKVRNTKTVEVNPSGCLCQHFQKKFLKHHSFVSEGDSELTPPTPEQLMQKTIISGDLLMTNKLIATDNTILEGENFVANPDAWIVTGVTEPVLWFLPAWLVPCELDANFVVSEVYSNVTDPFGRILKPSEPTPE